MDHGLVGALLVGVSYAKALAYANKIPLVGVNHIQGHIAANYITYHELKPPFLCVMMSRRKYWNCVCKKLYKLRDAWKN